MRTIKLIVPYLVIILTHILTAGTETMPFNSIPRDKFTNTKIVNVLDYGSIQDAIDAAPVGSMVYIPRGNYTVTEPITINKRMDIVGSGRYTQIYQSSDDHLFVIGAGATHIQNIRFEDVYLGSAATTPGKSLLELTKCHRSHFLNIHLAGGYYGVHICGGLGNTFTHLVARSGDFFAPVSSNQYWVYAEPNPVTSIHPNANTFTSPIFEASGNGGFWIDDGPVNIIGGIVEAQSTMGIHIQNVHQYFLVQGVHLEAMGSSIELVNCSHGEISQCYSSVGIDILRSHNILVSGGFLANIGIDKFSSQIRVDGVLTQSLSNKGSACSITNMQYTWSPWSTPSGEQNRSPRNLVDGDLEVWPNGLPIGFTKFGTGAVITPEPNIVKFGNYSAKVSVGPSTSHSTSTLRYEIDFNRLARLDPTNYRSSAYKWTASTGGTDEYYCELATDGDPGIDIKPYALLTGGTRAAEGTIGSLSPGEWDYGDNDSLDYNTIYVRLSGGGDPDAEASGYIEGCHRLHYITASCWAYKPEVSGCNPQVRLIQNPGGGSNGGSHNIPVDEWTRVSRTFAIDPSFDALYVSFGSYLNGNPDDTCYYDGIEIVEGDSASPIYDDSRGMNSDLRVGGRFYTNTITEFADSDATPGISAGNIFKTANTSATTITMFDDGVVGQEIKVIFGDGNTTIDFTGTQLRGNGGADWSPAPGDHMTCVFDGTYWYCDTSNNT